MFQMYRKTVTFLIAVATFSLLLLVMAACSNPDLTSTTAPVFGNSLNTTQGNTAYAFQTLNNNTDPTFNQLLGINNQGVIAGYYGSGTVVNGTLHPNKGYTLSKPYGQGNYRMENFPHSVQTQVTGINNSGNTVGFWVDGKGNNFGFVKSNGVFKSYRDPHTGVSNGVQINQLLGINDHRVAVGFYTDSKGNDHAYKLDLNEHKFIEIRTSSIHGAVSAMATGINNNGDVVGTYTDMNGATHGFLLKNNSISEFDFMGVANVTNTSFLGINNHDQIVGFYTVGSGNTAQTHGLLLSSPLHGASWQTLDDPNGIGTTTINGLNDNGDLVGFYVDGGNNTDGLLARKF